MSQCVSWWFGWSRRYNGLNDLVVSTAFIRKTTIETNEKLFEMSSTYPENFLLNGFRWIQWQTKGFDWVTSYVASQHLITELQQYAPEHGRTHYRGNIILLSGNQKYPMSQTTWATSPHMAEILTVCWETWCSFDLNTIKFNGLYKHRCEVIKLWFSKTWWSMPWGKWHLSGGWPPLATLCSQSYSRYNLWHFKTKLRARFAELPYWFEAGFLHKNLGTSSMQYAKDNFMLATTRKVRLAIGKFRKLVFWNFLSFFSFRICKLPNWFFAPWYFRTILDEHHFYCCLNLCRSLIFLLCQVSRAALFSQSQAVSRHI